MTWIGKVGGGILGFIAGGPVGAMIGTALGHQFDRGADARLRGRLGWEGEPTSPADRQRLFVETTFQALGHLSKADGRVSEDEIEVARGVMRQLGLDEPGERRAIECFNLGKQRGFPLRARALALRRACVGHPELIRTFLEIQLHFLLSKGAVSVPERTALFRLADAVGVSRLDLVHLEALLRGRRGYRRQAPATASELSLPGAYRALGLDPGASDRQVKMAYRRLMNEYHPDKQAGRGASPTELEAAKERTREVRAAYELIRARRGMQ